MERILALQMIQKRVSSGGDSNDASDYSIVACSTYSNGCLEV